MTVHTGLFQAARLESVSSAITSQIVRGRMKLQGYQVCSRHTRIFRPLNIAALRVVFIGPVIYVEEANLTAK